MRRAFLFLSLLTSVILSAFPAETTLFMHGSQAIPGDTAQLTLSLTSVDAITSFEADLALVDGMTVVAVSMESPGFSTDHVVRTRLTSGQTIHIGCWSPTNAVLGKRITLSIAVSENIKKGKYSLSLTEVLLVTPDGACMSFAGNTAIIEINDDGHSDKSASFFLDAPLSQAWYLRNADTDLFMHLNSITQKITLEKSVINSTRQQFFLEPAYELEEGSFYLRNIDGFYLCCSPDGSSNDISVSNQPNTMSAFILTETGDRTYSLILAGSTKRLAASGTTAGQELCISQSSSRSQWQLFKAEASHTSYLKRLYTTSAQCEGLTQGQADFELRSLRHFLCFAMDEGMDDKEAAASIDRLGEAVTKARSAYASGDTTVVETQWLAAEKLTAERVITVVDANGKTHFLSLTDGNIGLSDMFYIITPEASASILQDIFYNPYIDGYAIRLSGPDTNNSGTYLTVDALTAVLADTVITTLTETLSMWTVLSLPQAVERYLTLSGKSGTNVNWVFDLATGTLTFKGLLRTNSYVKPESRPWHIYRHLIRHVVFSGEINLLGSYLLADCTNIEDITFITDTTPVPGNKTFDGIPEGIDIYAPNPDLFEGYLPECKTHFLVRMQEIYIYDGSYQTPVIEGPYEASVVDGELQKDAGTYTSVFTIAISIDGKTYNYTSPYTYTIQPAPLTISTHDYTRTYGSKNPSFLITVNGLKGEDTEKSVFVSKPIATCEADEMSPVGTYPILLSGIELSSDNYEVSYQHAVLIVQKKRLYVYANDTTRYEGEANPPFTYTCEGFVNGDDDSVLTEKPVLSCDADSTSPPGKYPIIVSGGAAHDYSISTVMGILTVLEVSDVKAVRQDEEGRQTIIYNIQGQRISTIGLSEYFLAPGIYLINGKKIIIK